MLKHAHSDNRNRSFASPRLNVLKSVEFNSSVQPSDTIVFIHPPKTGGTNLCYVTDAISKKNSHFKTTRFPVPRIPDQSPGLIAEHWMGGLKSALATLSDNPDYCKDINFISGHFPIGLHLYLEKPVKYIVLVRDPIERSISSTNFDYQRGYIDKEHAGMREI